MRQTVQDLYPTRLIEKRPRFRRVDPVVHASYEQQKKGPLTLEQIMAFERDGFLSLEPIFTEDEMQGFLDDLEAYERDEEIKRRSGVILEPRNRALRSIFEIHKLSQRFDRLTRDPRVLDIVNQILGTEVYIHQSRINHKPAFRGRGFNWHSDFETWHSEDGMPRMKAISFSVILTRNTEFNGPLMLVPGSHRWFVSCVGETPEENWKNSLKEQILGVPDAKDLGELIEEGGGIVAPKGRAGSVVIFDCNTMHASNRNLSPYNRSNLFFVYNARDNALQEPFCGRPPRPEFLATRKDFSPLRRI